jgi:Site-specific recombinase XerD
MQRCKSVILRQRPRRNGTISLYLHFYPGYRDPETLEIRTKKSLDLYIYANPQTKAQKEYNAEILEKAEAIRCQVYMEVVNEKYGFFSKKKENMNFVSYFENLSKKNHIKWQYTFKHFAKFIHGDCKFSEITVDLCRKFMEYLDKDATRLSSDHLPLNKNTAADYWIVFRNALRHAYRDHYINENIVDRLDYIKWVPTIKESLTLDEVRELYNTPCVVPVMRKAALFSCLTGIRRSDIINMTWDCIRSYADGGKYVDFICQKTRIKTTVPLSNEALTIIEYTGNHNPKGKIFEGFTKEVNNKELKDWILDAGISKHITFHCFRHTYASLQLELGTDIYTVQHLLAHKNVSTTQIYACHADPKIREAADKIKLTDVNAEDLGISVDGIELETKSETTEKTAKQTTRKQCRKH